VIRLAECTYRQAARLARNDASVVLLPVGAIEQHGPHLPLLVDWLGAEELARRLAPYLRRAGFLPILAPSLPYGVSPLAADWSGTVSLTEKTLRHVVVEIIRALASHGFRRFVLTNYQADPGHLRALASIKTELGRRRRLQVLFGGFAPGAHGRAMFHPSVRALLRSPRPEFEWHSGEMETALMLALRPELVRRAVARRLPPDWVDFRRALGRGARTFREMNPDGRGYFGWPKAARARTGRAALALRARLIARELVRALRARRPAPKRRSNR
jgi:creatinine amidohydrolase/Fe(II)-dependent formamide hydrolase-like protein